MQLTSPQNPLLKDIRKAIARGTLTSAGCCVAESFHLLEEALRSPCKIQAVVAADSALSRLEQLVDPESGMEVFRVSDKLFTDVSSTETSQGLIALVQPPTWTLQDVLLATPLVTVLDGVQDPGNAGAILRAAEAFGGTGAIFLKGSVNPYGSKALRASAGSLFRIPLVTKITWDTALSALHNAGVHLFAAMPQAPLAVHQADLRGPSAIVIGSEGGGVRESLLHSAAGLCVRTRNVESLNAAVAAAVILYEASRQRSTPL